jgi:hypothetical protein
MTISFRDIHFLFWIPFIRTPGICMYILPHCKIVCVIAFTEFYYCLNYIICLLFSLFSLFWKKKRGFEITLLRLCLCVALNLLVRDSLIMFPLQWIRTKQQNKSRAWRFLCGPCCTKYSASNERKVGDFFFPGISCFASLLLHSQGWEAGWASGSAPGSAWTLWSSEKSFPFGYWTPAFQLVSGHYTDWAMLALKSLFLTNYALRHENMWGSGRILGLDTSWSWVVCFVLRPLYPRGKINQKNTDYSQLSADYQSTEFCNTVLYSK